MKKKAFITAALLMVHATTWGATLLHYRSAPGDYIGQGEEHTYTSDELQFSPQRNWANGVSFSMNNFVKPYPENNVWWYADFAAPYDGTLTPRIYENARRFPFQDPSEPGLDFSGEGRGCSTLSGKFEVLEAVYDEAGGIAQFAVNFEQHCDGSPAALLGEIRYNSEVPVSWPATARIDLLTPVNSEKCIEATGPAGGSVTLSGTSSRDANGGTSLGYSWSTSTGVTATTPTITFNVALNESVTAQLTVEDLTNGKKATAKLPICTSDTTPPVVTIVSPKEGDTLVGMASTVVATVKDAVDEKVSTATITVGAEATMTIDPSTKTGSISLQTGTVGTPLPVSIKATATDASGNAGTATVKVFKAHDQRIK